MWWMAAAQAATLVPTWTVGEHRQVKIDLFAYAPGLHPWGTDWQATRLEQWTVVVDCETIADRVERCSFVSEPWWGWVMDASAELQSVSLPKPGTVEITWTKVGRMQAFDPAVDAGEFGDRAADLQLQATYHRKDVVYKPDGKREIGNAIWTALARDVASALEVELPRKGEETAWDWSKPPTITRRYVQGIASGRVAVTATPSDAGVKLVLDGRVSESLPSGDTSAGSADTEVKGEATVNPANGRPTSVRWDTRTTSSSMALVGHTQHLVLVQPFREGDDPGPSPMPMPAF